MLDVRESKPCIKTKKVINRGKRSKSKNLQSFLEISPVEKEVFSSHTLRDHAYEY